MEPLNTLKNIHNEHTVTPIYKTNRNVSFICLQFYTFVLIKELGLNQNTTSLK